MNIKNINYLYKKIISIILIIVLAILLSSCGENKTAQKKLNPDYETKLVESGWSYQDGAVRYAFKLKNTSKSGVCLTPSVTIEYLDEDGKIFMSDVATTTMLLPGRSAYYASIGQSTKTSPAEVRISAQKTYDWDEFNSQEYDIKQIPLKVVDYGIRAVDIDQMIDEDSEDINFDAELKEMEKFINDDQLLSEEESDSQSQNESKAKESVDSKLDDIMDKIDDIGEFEYYGTITNENSCDYDEVLVVAVYRDSNSNLIGGESFLIKDINKESDNDFTFTSYTADNDVICEVYAYPW